MLLSKADICRTVTYHTDDSCRNDLEAHPTGLMDTRAVSMGNTGGGGRRGDSGEDTLCCALQVLEVSLPIPSPTPMPGWCPKGLQARESANYLLLAKPRPLPGFVHKVILECSLAHSFAYCLQLQWQG